MPYMSNKYQMSDFEFFIDDLEIQISISAKAEAFPYIRVSKLASIIKKCGWEDYKV